MYEIHVLDTDAIQTVDVRDGECVFCKAGHVLVKWERPGDIIYLCEGDGDDHCHEVQLIRDAKADGLGRIITCRHVTADEARMNIQMQLN